MIEWRRLLRVIEPHPGEHFKDKIIAVTLAFLVWFAVNNEQTYPRIFQAVPVSTVNLPPGLAFVADMRDTVTVWVSGSDRDLQRVTQGMLSPRVDLSTAVEGENVFPLSTEDLNAPTGVQVTSIEPAEIRVELEARVERTVPVSPVTAGEPADGYEVVGRSTAPEEATIAGPRSVIEATERLPTSLVDVSGRNESFRQRVALEPPDFVEVPGPRTVELRIEIAETSMTEQFDGVIVDVVNGHFRIAVNPQRLSVVLSGPPSVLAQIDAQQIRMVIDADSLQPRAEDYVLEPTVQLDQDGLAELIELIGVYPQRRVNVHVFNQPGRP